MGKIEAGKTEAECLAQAIFREKDYGKYIWTIKSKRRQHVDEQQGNESAGKFIGDERFI